MFIVGCFIVVAGAVIALLSFLSIVVSMIVDSYKLFDVSACVAGVALAAVAVGIVILSIGGVFELAAATNVA